MTVRKCRAVPTAVAAVLLLTVLVSATGHADDWPQFRGKNRDGRSGETDLLTTWPEGGPKLLWSATGIGEGFTHVSVASNLIYATGLLDGSGFLHAYSPDGKLEWRANYGPEWSERYPGARSVPTVYEGLVYVTSGTGNVACLHAETGAVVWSVALFEEYQAPQVKWGFAESVLIDGDNVIATPCGEKATMVALNRKTGEPAWASPALGQGSSFCSPVLVERGGKRAIVTMLTDSVVAFSADDGSIMWQHPYENFRKNHPITPVHQGEMLYVTSGYGKGAIGLVLSEDGLSVKQLWEQPQQDPCHGQAVLVDGYVYASSHRNANGRWTCVELATGNVAWEDGGVGKGGSVIYADGMLYCYSEDGYVGLVRPSPERCEVVSKFRVPLGSGEHWAHPVVADGRLYIRHGDAVMCYDIAQD